MLNVSTSHRLGRDGNGRRNRCRQGRAAGRRTRPTGRHQQHGQGATNDGKPPPGQPAPGPVPVGATHQSHAGGHQHQPHDRRVEQHANGQADTQLLEKDQLRHAERRERGDQDKASGGNDARSVLEPAGDRLLVVACLAEPLGDPRQHEHLVVRRQAEKNDEQQGRRDHEQLALRLQADQVRAPAVLEDQHHRAVRGDDRKGVQHDRLERQHQRTEQQAQDDKSDCQDDGDQQREAAVQRIGVVFDACRQTAHEDVVRPQLGDAGHDALADVVDQRLVVVVERAGADVDGDARVGAAAIQIDQAGGLSRALRVGAQHV